jgi:hypothetical protein
MKLQSSDNFSTPPRRFRETPSGNKDRIVRLIEAKKLSASERSRMIDILYTKDVSGDQNVDVRKTRAGIFSVVERSL